MMGYRIKSPVTNAKLRRVLFGIVREAGGLSGWQPKQNNKTVGLHEAVALHLNIFLSSTMPSTSLPLTMGLINTCYKPISKEYLGNIYHT